VLEKFVDQMFLDATNTNYSSKRKTPPEHSVNKTPEPKNSYGIPRRLQSAKRLALLDTIFSEDK